MKCSRFLIVLMAMVLISIPLFSQSNGKIVGKVLDEATGNELPAANITVEGTMFGSATDIYGEYVITNVPPGMYTLNISYIGYESKEVDVMLKPGGIQEVNVSLAYVTLKGEEVVVTAQAEGQIQAINQQISSNTIKNIVSSKKIQELPESNAAEAVGRLPGISLQREGGEGNKVVIRGLSPRYSKVQIEGVSMAATGSDDRSTDLSMISPYMLDGIEVQKAASADNEADQLGGTVNFKIKEASDKPMLTAVLQGGYNGLREEYGDYKFVLGGSKRFFDNCLGVFANLDLERRNRGDHSVFATYEMQKYNEVNYPIVNSVGYQDIHRIKDRLGLTAVIDYKLPATKVKLFSTYYKVDNDVTLLREFLDARSSGSTAREHRYTVLDSTNNIETMTNALKIEQYVGNFKINAGASYASSKQEIPHQYRFDGVEENAFISWFSHESPVDLNGRKGTIVDEATGYGFLHPTEFASVANNDTSSMYVEWLWDSESKTTENEYAFNLDLEYQTELTDLIGLEVKFGGKYKHKEKEYNFESYEHAMWWTAVDIARESWYPLLQDSPYLNGYIPTNTRFPYGPFIDTEYDAGNFLAGNYELNRIPNKDMSIEYLKMVPRTDETNAQGLVRNFNNSIPNDFDGHEDYFAAYIMPTFKVGDKFTFIPGFRYEQNKTIYSGVRAAVLGQWDDPFPYNVVETERENDYFLPMIHTKYNITDWFDVRASYTQTISRPSYNLIIPSWTIIPDKHLSWNNPYLEPMESENIDLYFSFYGNTIGLFTVGLFQKTISNFIYNQTLYITDEEMLIDAYPDIVRKGSQVFGFINNPNDADLSGLEVEWQSNLWFLPGLLSNVVLNANYTYTHSDLAYPLNQADYDTTAFGGIYIVGNVDATYNTRLIDQPNHLLNFSVGYDYKGFSIRGSMRYKSDVFLATNYYEELRQNTDPLTLFDLSVKQQLPIDGLQLYFNGNNLTKSIDTNINQGTSWFSRRQYYGMTLDLGLRYDIF